MSFIISPIEERHLKIAPDCFVEQLKETWPKTETHYISNQTRPFILEWQLSCQQHPLTGMLYRTLDAITLDGPTEDCAKVAVWYRHFIPTEYKLLFLDEGYHAHIELRDDTTEQEIIDAFTW